MVIRAALYSIISAKSGGGQRKALRMVRSENIEAFWGPAAIHRPYRHRGAA